MFERKLIIGESVGTFGLVFAGTGAIVVNDVSGGAVTHPGIALTFGLIVLVMVYAVGSLSGAHLNPAVTFGFWLAGRVQTGQILPYVVSQAVGAGFASAVLWRSFPEHQTLGATLPRVGVGVAFLFEVLLTFFLMYVIFRVAVPEKETIAGLAIGMTVGLEAMFAGPITGASMNPVRSIAPAVFSRQLGDLWLYIVAPFVGAGLAYVVQRLSE